MMVQVDLRVLIRQERERRKQQSEASTSSRRNSDTEEQDLALLREGTAENAALGWTRWRIGNEIVKVENSDLNMLKCDCDLR